MAQRPKSQVRDALLDAARAAFAEGGFAGASVRDIARDAGVSLSNVYTYFESKDALFEAALEPTLAPLQAGVSHLRGMDLSDPGLMTAEAQGRMVGQLVDFLDAHREDLALLAFGAEGSSLAGWFDRLADTLAEAELGGVAALGGAHPERLVRAPSPLIVRHTWRFMVHFALDLLREGLGAKQMHAELDELAGYLREGQGYYVRG